MPERTSYHISLATDRNYMPHVAVVLRSLVDSNPGRQFEIHLLLNSVPDEDVATLRSETEKSGLILHIYNLSDLASRFPIKVNTSIVPLTSYARIFLPSLLPDDIDRVLYLDCDVLVQGELHSLWDVGTDNFSLLGVLDTPGVEAKTSIGLSADASYINAGILMINLDYWRRHNIQQACLDYIVASGGYVPHNDQGVINAVCHDTIKVIGPEYNMQSSYYSHRQSYLEATQNPCYDSALLKAARRSPIIVHFTEGYLGRPWRQNCTHPLCKVYRSYMNKRPLDPDTRSLALRMSSWFFMHTPTWTYNAFMRMLMAIKN